MHINPNIFREFSIRGIADLDLTNDISVRIGQAIGTFFHKRNLHSLIIGRDIRTSSERINQALIDGLLKSGLDLIDIGAVPTPVLNFSADLYKADGGVMITASHNPPDYNGLKVRTNHTLQGSELQEILHLAISEQLLSETRGTVRQVDPFPEYFAHLIPQAKWTQLSLKIVIDGGNGTNGPIVSSLLRDLGFEVIELFTEPDGNFPNRNPDPTASGATDALATAVLSHDAHLGIAYDGDGDRLVAVDDQGNPVLGDQLMMLLAREILRQGPAQIVYEILCTQALADDISSHGGKPIMTPSGYAFIHQVMQDTGAALGGELSGHLFFNEPHFHFDDAILATIKLLNIIAYHQQSLSQMVEALPKYHSSPEIRMPCPDDVKSRVVEQVRDRYRDQYKVEEIDGARIHFPDGWALVRQSNTQPIMSMRFEARSGDDLKKIQTDVQSLVESYIEEA